VYVALSNLDHDFQVAGPGMLARIEPGGGKPSPIYLSEACLNAYWLVAGENALVVSCAGRVHFDSSYHLVSSESTGLVLVDGADGGISSWNARCPSKPDCVPPSIYRFALVGDSLYAGDVGGRVFVVQNVGNELIERRGYDPVALGPPLAVCPSSPSGFGAVSDIISIP
jgi:hypothetical protein